MDTIEQHGGNYLFVGYHGRDFGNASMGLVWMVDEDGILTDSIAMNKPDTSNSAWKYSSDDFIAISNCCSHSMA